jgi:transposase-like protein
MSSSLSTLYAHPNCPDCGTQTVLARIEPSMTGFEIRTFDCRKCGYQLNLIVKFH